MYTCSSSLWDHQVKNRHSKTKASLTTAVSVSKGGCGGGDDDDDDDDDDVIKLRCKGTVLKIIAVPY